MAIATALLAGRTQYPAAAQTRNGDAMLDNENGGPSR
jgi:hypothetical protein